MVDVKTSFIYKDDYETVDDALKRILLTKDEIDKKSLLAARIQRLLKLYCSLFRMRLNFIIY